MVAAAAVLGVVLLATGLLKDLPQATLGAILVFVATRLFRVHELRSILRFDRLEFGLAVVTLLAVAFFGIEQGVVVAMLLSLADRTRRAARPRDAILGREPGTVHWIPTDIGRPTEQVPGIIVYLLYAPLWYGNADYIRARVRNIVDTAPRPGAFVRARRRRHVGHRLHRARERSASWPPSSSSARCGWPSPGRRASSTTICTTAGSSRTSALITSSRQSRPRSKRSPDSPEPLRPRIAAQWTQVRVAGSAANRSARIWPPQRSHRR